MRATLCALVLASVCASLAAQTPAPPAGAGMAKSDLSKEIRHALDDRFDKLDGFKKWRVASVDPQRASCRTDGAGSPAMATGDLNGDGRPDHAVFIQGDNRVQLVAVFERIGDFMVQDIDADAVGTAAAEGYLGLRKRGTAFVDPDTHLEDYYANDTLILHRCGQPSVAYLWSGASFRKIALPM